MPRKSHGRKRPTSHIPRPPNAFMLYRSDFLKKGVIPAEVESKQYNISRIVGECWKRLTSDERKPWTDLAKEKEEEHARMYPGYQYKPSKRGPVRHRRKAMTREQELDHCETLRAKYLPDKTGPVIQTPDYNPPRKRKSRAKSRVATQGLSPGGESSPPEPLPLPPAAIDSPAFMDPLLPPPPQCLPASLPSKWSKQPVPGTLSSYAAASLDLESEPPILFDQQIILHPSNFSHVQDVAPDHSPSLSSPAEMLAHRPTPLNVAAYLRDQIDNSHRRRFFPTVRLQLLIQFTVP